MGLLCKLRNTHNLSKPRFPQLKRGGGGLGGLNETMLGGREVLGGKGVLGGRGVPEKGLAQCLTQPVLSSNWLQVSFYEMSSTCRC